MKTSPGRRFLGWKVKVESWEECFRQNKQPGVRLRVGRAGVYEKQKTARCSRSRVNQEMRPGKGGRWLQPEGPYNSWQRVQVSSRGHGEPLEGLEVVCINRMPQAAVDSGSGRNQMEAERLVCGHPVRCDGSLACGSDRRGKGDGRVNVSFRSRIHRARWMVAGRRRC